ncbi:unnamed protein product, partial [Rotaria socialis]
VANYYTIEVNGKQAENVAWYYSKPTGPEFSSIKDHVAIYVGPMDECYVDGERVVPQPGQFYGGWITKDMVEPFKVGIASKPRPFSAEPCSIDLTDLADISTVDTYIRARNKPKVLSQTDEPFSRYTT